ncbi:MAG: hypothetical protein OIF55_20035, partial [Amphritea sp.]|nr:hypothetical protein [Amphritea sp.]
SYEIVIFSSPMRRRVARQEGEAFLASGGWLERAFYIGTVEMSAVRETGVLFFIKLLKHKTA